MGSIYNARSIDLPAGSPARAGATRLNGARMEIGRLEAFVQVSTLLSFSKAAEALCLTQPTVTARIQALERDLGEPLFERMGRTIRLSDAGQSFLPYAQRALHSIKEGRDALTSLRNVERGSLTIGTAPTVGTYVLPKLLRQFAERYPGVEVSIRTASRAEQVLAMVLADEVQVGFERHLIHPEIEAVPLYEDEISLLAGADHAVAGRNGLTVAEVAEHPVIFFDVGSSYHGISQAIFRDNGVAPRHTMDVDNLEMAKHLVLQGLGLAFLPRVAVERELAAGSLVAVEMAGVKPLRRRIALVYRRRRLQSRATLALLDLLNETYRFAYANPAAPEERAAGATAAGLVGVAR